MISPTQTDRAALRALMEQPPEIRSEILASLPAAAARVLASWLAESREIDLLPHQRKILEDTTHRDLVLSGGRGSGKSFAGALFIIRAACSGLYSRLAIVNATIANLRRDNLLGPSGVVPLAPNYYPATYRPSESAVVFPRHPVTGIIPRIELLSVDNPRRMRGVAFSKVWIDEPTTFPKSSFEEILSNIRQSLRLPPPPGGINQALFTLTPLPDVRIAQLLVEGPRNAEGIRTLPEGTLVVTAPTTANRKNLDAEMLRDIIRKYPKGSRRYLAEVEGKILADPENSLFTRERLQEATVPESHLPKMAILILGVDPSRSIYASGDLAGCIMAGRDHEGRIWILGDASTRAAPIEWSTQFAAAAHRSRADAIFYESNRLSADFINLIQSSSNIPWFGRSAAQKKFVRLQPALALLEKDQIRFLEGYTEELIDDLVSFDPEERRGSASSDRVDAFSLAVNVLLEDDPFCKR